MDSNGVRLTAILYLNKDWNVSKDGGQLRLFNQQNESESEVPEVKLDIDPIWNRLVIFWSNEEIPHEVRPTHKDRAAVTIFYECVRECFGKEESFEKLFIDR